MSTQFKNRLVGVTILVACVIIFLPSLIDGKKEVYMDEFVAVPIRPEIKAHTMTLADKVTSETDKQQIESNKKDKASIDNSNNNEVIDDGEWQVEEVAETLTVQKQTPPQKPIKKVKQFPSQAWTIQLGAFQSKKGINTLLKRLKKSGFQTHTIPREVVDGELTRVFVGPNVSKQKLKKQLPKLKKLTKLNGRIVAFDPVNP